MRRWWRPVPGQQFGEPVDGMGADACDHVAEPGLGLDAVEFCGPDQRVERGGTLAAAIRGQVIMPDVWRSMCWSPIRFIPTPDRRFWWPATLSMLVFAT